LLDEDAVLYEAKKNPQEEDTLTKPQREVAEDGTVTITTTSTMPVETILYKSKNGPPSERFYRPSLPGSEDDSDSDDDEYSNGDGDSDVDSDGDGSLGDSLAAIMQMSKVKLDLDDQNSVHVGLRVYTHKDAQVEITSRLRGGD
jgi:hypothetical protein